MQSDADIRHKEILCFKMKKMALINLVKVQSNLVWSEFNYQEISGHMSGQVVQHLILAVILSAVQKKKKNINIILRIRILDAHTLST